MKDEDKIVVEGTFETGVDTAIAIADEIVSKIPLLNLAWGLSKVVLGAGLKLRQKRALEWVEMVRDNPDVFTEDVLRSEAFQDGFVYALEHFLRERSEAKRKAFKKIFLGFASSEDKDAFPLEKYTSTLAQLTAGDISVLRTLDGDRKDPNYQVEDPGGAFTQNLYSLISAGILHDRTNGRVYVTDKEAPFISVSDYGREFKAYLVS